jgi:hypothetical protein
MSNTRSHEFAANPGPGEWGGILNKLLKAVDQDAEIKNLRKQLDEIIGLKDQLVAEMNKAGEKDPAVRQVETSVANTDNHMKKLEKTYTYDVGAVIKKTLAEYKKADPKLYGPDDNKAKQS